jgi:hypothetical protein
MRYTPIEYQGAFMLEGREIADGDRLELRWPDGQTVETTIKIIHGELRIVGTIRGIKCWIVLDHAVRKREILARWPKEDGYGQVG